MSDPLLTVFTDASFCPETNAGGWAVWAKRLDRSTFFKAGRFKDVMPGAAECEAAAVDIACWHLIRQGYLGGDQHVLIKTDCLEVIDKVGRFAHKDADTLEPYLRHLKVAKDKVRCLELRHVEGHKGTKTPRHAVNTRCDKAAKHHMRKMRKELQE